jgi:hypothetical protein
MSGYSKADIDAAVDSLNKQLEKVREAVNAKDFSKARAAIRAMHNECSHASRVAGALSLTFQSNDQRR